MKITNKKIYIFQIIVSVLAISIAIAMEIFWEINKELSNVISYITIFKSFIGLCYLLIAIPNSIKYKNDYHIIMPIALLCYSIGDILMKINFINGSIFFIVGHLIMIIYMLIANKQNKTNLITFIIIYLLLSPIGITSIVLKHRIDLGLAVFAYGIFISSFLSSSIKEKKSIVIAIMLFVISDAMLLINFELGTLFSFSHYTRMVYYLALTILVNTYKENDILR